MRSPLESPNANVRDETESARRGARFLWWSVLGGLLALALLVTVAAVMRGRDGARNQGPPDEIAPGANPSRDIDRTLNR